MGRELIILREVNIVIVDGLIVVPTPNVLVDRFAITPIITPFYKSHIVISSVPYLPTTVIEP